MSDFLENAWYVAAWSSEVTDLPRSQKIIGKSVVLYRDSAGKLIALENMCPHRFAPLDKGKVVGDHIECPYHGLRFDETGRCVYNPFSPDGSSMPKANVESYCVIERYKLVWIWMGDTDKVKPDDIPDFSWMDDDATYTFTSEGAEPYRCNYELIVDNLLDLSHGQFLHPTTLGNSAMAGGTTRSFIEGTSVYSERLNPNGDLPVLFSGSNVVAEGEKVDFWNDMRWDPAGSYYLEAGVTPVGQPRENGTFVKSAHILTPVDETTTIYRYIVGRVFQRDDNELTGMIEMLVRKAFNEEDEPMLKAVKDNMAGREFWSMRPVILEGDRAAIMARRILQKLMKAEADGPSS